MSTIGGCLCEPLCDLRIDTDRVANWEIVSKSSGMAYPSGDFTIRRLIRATTQRYRRTSLVRSIRPGVRVNVVLFSLR